MISSSHYLKPKVDYLLYIPHLKPTIYTKNDNSNSNSTKVMFTSLPNPEPLPWGTRVKTRVTRTRVTRKRVTRTRVTRTRVMTRQEELLLII